MQAVEHVALRGPVQVLQGTEAAQDGRERDEEETKKDLSDYGRLHVPRVCHCKEYATDRGQKPLEQEKRSRFSENCMQTPTPESGLVVPKG